MTKNELTRKYVDIKILWWSITENKEYYNDTKESLHKIIWKMSKADVIAQIGFLEERIANAKAKLQELS